LTTANVTTAARIEELVDRARNETALDDFGGDTWREGLEVLVGSAVTESRFNEFGEQMFYDAVVRALTNRLHIEDWFTRHPEIDDQEVHVELLGVGFPRTGSTALSHLLGEDRSVRSLRMWESSTPCPPPGVTPEADAARLAAAEAQLAAQEMALPQFKSMLPQSATGPMEDHDLMSLEFKAQSFLAFARLPSYAEWFLDCDQEPTYRYERRVLKLLQWKCPPNRWQLKSPTHTLFLDAFETVFPETRFVMTHRDVGKVLPSVADLYCTLLQGGNTSVDRHEVGQLNMEQWGAALDHCLAFRADGREDKFFDIGFTAFQADPIAQVRALYEWLGRDLTPDTEQRMRAWRDDNPRDKHGSHSYDGADFGLTDDALAARFGAYRERFGAFL
jgi:Sulfotransferase family